MQCGIHKYIRCCCLLTLVYSTTQNQSRREKNWATEHTEPRETLVIKELAKEQTFFMTVWWRQSYKQSISGNLGWMSNKLQKWRNEIFLIRPELLCHEMVLRDYKFVLRSERRFIADICCLFTNLYFVKSIIYYSTKCFGRFSCINRYRVGFFSICYKQHWIHWIWLFSIPILVI